MNAIKDRDSKVLEASERASVIREFREEVVGRPPAPRLHVIASKIVIENGRMVTKLLIDGSLQLGRGQSYWISSGAANHEKSGYNSRRRFAA